MRAHSDDSSEEIQGEQMEITITKPVPPVQLERTSWKEIQRVFAFESELEEEEVSFYNGKIEDFEVGDGVKALVVNLFSGNMIPKSYKQHITRYHTTIMMVQMFITKFVEEQVKSCE